MLRMLNIAAVFTALLETTSPDFMEFITDKASVQLKAKPST